MPRKSRKREGRRDTGPIRGVARGSNLAARSKESSRRQHGGSMGSEAAQSTSVFRKPSLFAGRRRKGTSGRVPAERGSLQPSRSKDAATRVLEGTREEGRSPVKRRVLRSAPSARAGHVAKVTRLARLALTVVPTRASGKARWATWVRRLAKAGEKGGRGLSKFTGEVRALEGCARASCRVAEVGRRRLAQRSVSTVLF